MTDSRTLGQSVPKEGLFLMDGIEGLRSLPKHSVDAVLFLYHAYAGERRGRCIRSQHLSLRGS